MHDNIHFSLFWCNDAASCDGLRKPCRPIPDICQHLPVVKSEVAIERILLYPFVLLVLGLRLSLLYILIFCFG